MPSLTGTRRLRRGRTESTIGSGSGVRHESGRENKKPAGMMDGLQENLTRFGLPGRTPMLGTKAGPLCIAAARGGPVCFLRSAGCGTKSEPVPVSTITASLVFPADFAATAERMASATPSGRPGGAKGGVSRGTLKPVVSGPETGDLIPVGFTPCGHFCGLNRRSASARIFNVVFSPGF